MSATGSRRRRDNAARGGTSARGGPQDVRDGPEFPPRPPRDATPAPPSSAGTSKRGQAPPVPPHTRGVNGSKASDPEPMAASAARVAMGKAEGDESNNTRNGGQPTRRMKKTLRGDRNGKITEGGDGHGHGPSPLVDKKVDKDTRREGVKGKLKNIFGGGKHDYEEEDEELPGEDNVPPKHKGSDAPRDNRKDAPDASRRRSGGIRPHEGRGDRGREHNAPHDESNRSPRERGRGPVPGSGRIPREGEKDSATAASKRERQQPRRAGPHPEADAYHHEDGQHNAPYTPESFFDPEELSTGPTCRTCSNPKPVCMACFVPLEKDRALTRMLGRDVSVEEAKRMRQGCPCGRCGRPIHVCEECGLPLRKEQVAERLQAEGKGRAKARR